MGDILGDATGFRVGKEVNGLFDGRLVGDDEGKLVGPLVGILFVGLNVGIGVVGSCGDGSRSRNQSKWVGGVGLRLGKILYHDWSSENSSVIDKIFEEVLVKSQAQRVL